MNLNITLSPEQVDEIVIARVTGMDRTALHKLLVQIVDANIHTLDHVDSVAMYADIVMRRCNVPASAVLREIRRRA